MNDIVLLSSERGMECRKRRISQEDSTITASLDPKRPRVSVLFRLESESSLDSSQDDTESVYSIQDKETDVARDTSDAEDSDLATASGSELESGAELVTLEYDVASLSSDGGDFPDYTSSGTEDLNIKAAAEGAFAAVLLDTSLESWENNDDTSEGSTIFDAFDFEECRRDFWTCLQCKLHNDNPAYRYCDKCFQKCWQCKMKKTFKGFPLCIGCYKERKTFFPPRPRPSRKRKHHDESSSAQQRVKLDTLQSYLKELKDNPAGSARDYDAASSSRIPDMNFGEILVPQNHLQRKPTNVIGVTERPLVDEKVVGEEVASNSSSSTRTHDARAGSDSDLLDEVGTPRKKRRLTEAPESDSVSNLRRHTDDTPQHSDSKPESDSGVSSRHTCDTEFEQGTPGTRAGERCIMCESAPKNGIFLHGNIGHMCCCYKCAMRVWRTCKRCPVCNGKVKNVVKLFTC